MRSYSIIRLMAICLVLILLPVQISAVAGEDGVDDQILSEIPTRTIVDESESNNDLASADQLPTTTSYELHGNISSSSDRDFFKIDLTGGGGPVDMFSITPKWLEMDSNVDYIVVWISAYYPNTNSESVILVNFYDEAGIWWRPMTFYASYSGTYGVRFEPYNSSSPSSPINGNIEYNFTISVTKNTPVDSTNDQGSSSSISPGKGTINTGVNVVNDMMDWYSISAPDPLHPTRLDMTLTLNSPYPDFTSGTIYYGIELDVYISYNTRSDPGTFTGEVHRLSVGTVFQMSAVGCDPSPKRMFVEKNCTQMYIGIVIRSYGVDSQSTAGRTYQIMTEGRTNYVIDYEIDAHIPNNRPQLLNSSVTPDVGTSSDIFEFIVTYRDLNNHSAESVNLWLDDQFFRSMSPMAGEGTNNVLGVRYSTTVLGSSLGADMYHSFNFSANDEEDWALDRDVGVHIGPVVDDNQAPGAVRPQEIVELYEDQEEYIIELDVLFEDPDPLTKFSYDLIDADGNEVKSYTTGNLTATIFNNGSAEILQWALKVVPVKDVSGIFYVHVNATDDGFHSKSAQVEIKFIISPENDDPEMRYVKIDSENYESEYILSFTREQNERVEVTIIGAEDKDGDELTYHWDIDQWLADPAKGHNYDWDVETGVGWFVTNDADVGTMYTRIGVTDGNGGKHEEELEFRILNINDPPYIIVPEFKSTIEGENIYITPVAGDLDIDSGDEIEFNYFLGDLERNSPAQAFLFDPVTGRLVIRAISESMNGEWEINFTVGDLWGEVGWGVCRILIENVNDAPIARDISYGMEEGNLTVNFFTSVAVDEDGVEGLEYIWDFGDGSDVVSGVDGLNVDHTFKRGGVYTIILKVFDGEEYSDEVSVIVKVTEPPEPDDGDDDGILDEWERRYGLDPTDPSDAILDFDEDGLTNFQEFEYYKLYDVDLNPRNPDSDGDGYYDGEEVNYGFDPMDRESHPTPEMESTRLMLLMLIMIFTVVAVIALLLFIVLRIRNKPQAVAVASPMAPQLDAGGYQALPPTQEAGVAGYSALPPAEAQLPNYQDQQEQYPLEGYHDPGQAAPAPEGQPAYEQPYDPQVLDLPQYTDQMDPSGMAPPQQDPIYEGTAPPAGSYPEPVQAPADPAAAQEGVAPTPGPISSEAQEPVAEPSQGDVAPLPAMPPEPEVGLPQAPVATTTEEAPPVQQPAEE